MSEIAVMLTILAITVVIFVWNKIPVEIVAIGVALILFATGIIGIDDAFSGFGSQTVILIAALFVVAESIDAAGITTWMGGLLVKFAGDSRPRLIALIMLFTALLTAIISVNGAVAALLPMVVVLAVRLGREPGQLLMPMAFAAHAGSLLVLTGSPVNILILEAAIDSTGRGIGFFEFALVGLPLLIGTIVVAIYLGPKLLPQRVPEDSPKDLSDHPRVLLGHYWPAEHELVRLLVPVGSGHVGDKIAGVLPATRGGVHLLSVQNAAGKPLSSDVLGAGNYLVVRGTASDIADFALEHEMAVDTTHGSDVACGLVSKSFGVAEVLVAPRSNLIDTSVYPGMVTESGSLVVLAHQRAGKSPESGANQVKAGDTLLLQGSWNSLDQHTRDQNVLLVDSPDAIRRQTVPLGPGAIPALIILAAMVVMMTTNIVPASVAALLAAMAMVLTRVVTMGQAHRSMSWQTLILVAGMIPLSAAITKTGTAEMLANGIVYLTGGSSPYLLLLGIFVVTAVLGQLISNTATALIIIPIALSVANEAGLSALTVLMCVSVASAAALLTPIATPANMMIMRPAGYKFGDYWKFGLVIMSLYVAVAVFLVPVFWPF
ncbi:SLC13 family permease [Arthrobacter glacialis]|uniref:SLC13 family permease n=1 Tax=Arthrobacter glacialis TaxID=1664 RepID=UPI000CD486C3|nr:SLC13 family permease [Arthrobacter glacialis]POH58380.1 SLC13 family permease [Arthrobacter glacialis]